GDADWGLRPMLATESEPPMSFNISYYENEKVDQLLKDGLATADEDKRGEIYGEVQDIVWKDLPLLCIASDKNIWATSNNITGVY
ncbi:glutathione ABC transporter substrate-binding protein, partial [Escherichia coli]|nr:glutathione ABC transporter substrate-binding protein [Escherichia coli]